MKRILTVLFTLIICSARMHGAAGEPTNLDAMPKNVLSVLERASQNRNAALAHSEWLLQQYRSGKVGVSQGGRDVTAETIKAIEADLASMRGAPKFFVPNLSYPIQVGEIGSMPGEVTNVKQVVNDKEMLLNVYFGARTPVILLCRGVSTKSVADGTGVKLPNAMHVTGTHRYITVTGSSNTVYAVEPIDLSKYDLDRLFAAYLRARAESEAIEAFKQRWQKEKRTWTDKSGKFSVLALYDSYLGNGVVRLRKEDRSTVDVRVSSLSEKDRREVIRLRQDKPKKKG